MSRQAVVVVAVVAVATLAACGGSASDSSQITGVIKDIGRNPTALCDTYATRALLAQVGGRAACEAASRAAGASEPKVTVDRVVVSGRTAVATITGDTGDNTLRFVKQDGSWKVAGVSK